MKIIALHSDFIEITPKKKAIKGADKVDKKSLKFKECLVVLSAAQTKDESNPNSVAKNLSKHVEDIAGQVNTKNIVLYPYVHLVSDPSNPKVAKEILNKADKLLKKKFKVNQAPFGWYKQFNIKCKGHPLSELSREFGPEGEEKEESKALEAEKTLKSYWYVLDKKGKLSKINIKNNKIEGFNFSKYKNLEKFAIHEISKGRTPGKEPKHIELMKKLNLIRYEGASDPGNLSFLPNGRLVKALLEEKVSKDMHEYGAMEVETPLMYDLDHPTLKSYLNRFPARQYTVKSPNNRLFLRFAACFGQFLMASDSIISYKHLPLRLYELTRYSFRAEQRGELAGLRRLRAFTMPDCHAFCADEKQAKEELLRRLDVAMKEESEIGLDVPGDLELGIRVTKDFWKKNKDFLLKLVKKWNKPAIVEMWDKQFFYFIFKYELNFVDSLDKAAALTTDQIDVNNAKTYDITYVDKNSKKKNPLILHLSPSGAIERVIYALLEKAAMSKNPVLPLWLSPTQVRICPVSDKFTKDANKLADKIEKEHIRVDVDDRIESIGKKVSDAQKEFIPFVIVYGDKEKKGTKLPIRSRETNKINKMTLEQFVKRIKKETSDKPFRGLALPRNISKRPTFS
ncbi:MAG: threonine--tRNA ligase [Candidatus Woesearchaeota archaeon]|nr:MAG: threonine--tRNA ligase [Candidatus Woesearchaeota archaeon]